MSESAVIPAAERPALQRRTLSVLIAGQLLGGAALTCGIAVTTLVMKDQLDSDTWAGVAGAVMTMGSAFASSRLAGLMVRKGRRAGLQLAYAVATVGAGVAFAGVQWHLTAVFLVGMAAFGWGQAATLAARFAAADLAEPEHRGKAISTIVFGQTVGAVAGPLLAAGAGWVGDQAGLDELAGPFLLALVLYLLARLNSTRLRPDPLAAVGGIDPEGRRPKVALGTVLADAWSRPGARMALIAMVTSQAVMVAVMTMTPAHMKDHGHGVTLVSIVIAVHVLGMFGPAPIAGWLCDRYGSVRVIAVGGGVLLASTVTTALAGAAPSLLFVGLFLLGVGWSFGLVGGSSLLTAAVDPARLVQTQGGADLLMSLAGGSAAFASGFVKRAAGFHVLSDLGSAATMVMLALALRATFFEAQRMRVMHPASKKG